MKNKKPFKESGLGMFLKQKFPSVLDVVGDILPDKGMLGIVKNLISKDTEGDPDDRIEALRLLHEYELTEMQEITKRWSSDMMSDSWLSKNVRPMTLIYLLLLTTVLVIGDSVKGGFTINIEWILLLKITLLTVIGAYFGSRGYEKIKKINGN